MPSTACCLGHAEVSNLGCAAVAVLSSKISLGLPSDLLYRLNCHVDKQLAVRDLLFIALWIADNNRRGEQIPLQLDNKPLNPKFTNSIS